MMHADPRNLVIAVVVIVVALFILGRLWRIMNSNLQLIANVLHGEINYPVLNLAVYFVVEGTYNGRRVACYCNPLGSGKRSGGDTKFSIEPHRGLEESSFYSLSDDGPTDVTYVDENKIFCREPVSSTARQKWKPIRRASLFSPITRQELITYLDQLTAAAELVENCPSKIPTTA